MASTTTTWRSVSTCAATAYAEGSSSGSTRITSTRLSLRAERMKSWERRMFTGSATAPMAGSANMNSTTSVRAPERMPTTSPGRTSRPASACAVAAAREATTSKRTGRGSRSPTNPVTVEPPCRSAACSSMRETSNGVSAMVPNTVTSTSCALRCGVRYRPGRPPPRAGRDPREGDVHEIGIRVVCCTSVTGARSSPRPESSHFHSRRYRSVRRGSVSVGAADRRVTYRDPPHRAVLPSRGSPSDERSVPGHCAGAEGPRGHPGTPSPLPGHLLDARRNTPPRPRAQKGSL